MRDHVKETDEFKNLTIVCSSMVLRMYVSIGGYTIIQS